MRAIILAGGPGSRLLPLTKDTPKCLLEVAGKKILDHQIDTLQATGVREIGIVTGFQAEKIEAHVATRDDVRISFIHNADYQTTNSAYGLYLAKDFATADPEGFLVLNSDLLFSVAMLETLLKAPETDAMIIRPGVRDSDMCNIVMEDDRIIRMSKEIPAAEAQAEAVGPIKFSHTGGQTFIALLKDEPNNWVFYMLSAFAASQPFYGIPDNGEQWAEIDTAADLAEAETRFTT